MAASNRKDLYSPEVHKECLERIHKLTAATEPQWGRMTAAQMLSHCAEILEVSNGKELKGTPFIAKLFKGMIRKMVVGDKPYPRSTQTHPQYVQKEDRDFDQEKQRLMNEIDKAVQSKDKEVIHPLFGTMTPDEKGWAMYKHLDHHLTQFGV